MIKLATTLLVLLPLPFLTLFWKPDLPTGLSSEPSSPVFQVEEEAALNCPCTVTQGAYSAPLPFLSGNVPVASFYGYGVPTGSSANTGLELSNTLVLMLYEDTNTGNVSMVFIADIAGDSDGGEMDITFNCMPNSAFVAVADDGGEFFGAPPTFTGNFTWAACCTDGGAIGGLGCGYTFTINPDLISGINDFSLVYGTVANPTYLSMPNFDCPITINCGGSACCAEAFEFSANVQNASCSNSANGSISLTTNCATAPTYQWSNGAQTPAIFNLTPGSYSVTITDANGCSLSDTYVVSANSPAPTPAITGPTSFCSGQTVVLGVSGGSYTSYQWSNGQQTPSIAISTGGVYSVTVTNSAGCTGTASINVTQNPSPMPSITGPTAICFGDAVLLNAGTGYTSYNWSTGANTPTALVTQPGGYSVTVTNSFGCSGVAFTVVQPLPSPVPVITGPTSICAGELITLDAGTGFASYSWSTGATTQTISVSTAGTYSVTVTNNEGCEAEDTQVITASPGPDPAISGPLSFCPGDTVVLTADAGYAGYSWSSGQTTQAIQVFEPGLYIVEVTDSQGCTGTDSLQVDTLASFTPVIAGVTQLCPGDTSILDAGSYSSYEWSTGETTQTISVSAAGNYAVTVTGTGSCTGLASVDVVENPGDSLWLYQTSCNPQDTGIFVEVYPNQFGCDSVEITTISYAAADTVLFFDASCFPQDTGVFVQLLTNQFGCDSLVVETIALNPSDTLYLFATSCNPQDTGVFVTALTNQFGCDSLLVETISFSEADTVFTFSSSCNPQDTGIFVTALTNQFGCDSLLIHNVGYSESDTTYLFGTSCNPQDTGVFMVILTNQYGCDSFLIQTVTLLPTDTIYLFGESCFAQDTGVFIFNYTNQYGCDSVEIETVSFLPTDTIYLFGESCFAQDTGVFIFNYTNQYGCDSVEIETVSFLPTDTIYLFGESCFAQDTGVFIFNYTNQYGCDSVEIETVSFLPTDTIYLFGESCFAQDTGVFIFNYTNQYGCDSVEIETVSFLPTDTTYLFDLSCNPQDTGHFVNVYVNQFGCDSTVFETVSLLPGSTTYIYNTSCSPQDTGVFVFNYLNQYGCDSIEIETVSLLPSDTVFLFAGTCEPGEAGTFVTVYANQYGCDSLEVLEVSLLPQDSCALTVGVQVQDVQCFGGSNGAITLAITGGNVPIQCDWASTDGSLSGTSLLTQFGQLLEIQGLPAGTYTLVLTDPNGLEWEEEIVVGTPPLLTASVGITSDFFGFGVSCAGGTDGSLQGSGAGGSGSYSYIWSNGSVGNTTLNNLPAGAYELTITDANGCEATADALLTEPLPLVAELETVPADCKQGNRLVVADISGGIPPYLVSLDGGAFSSQMQYDDLSPGVHEIVIEDAVACAWTGSAALPAIPEYWADLGPDTVIVLGTSYTLQLQTNLSLIDTIIWTPSPAGLACNNCTNLEVRPLNSATYSVIVRDINGCEATAEVTVGVIREQDFFVPNVISANADGINDEFTVFAGPTVQRIRSMLIFDRWGGQVFENADFPPNDPSYGWDGRKEGKPVHAGVYVYLFEIEYVDGLTLTVKGDVTVLW